MEFKNDKVFGINIAYIGGGSRNWAWNLISDLAMEEQLSGTVNLYDINYEAAHSNEIIGNNLKNRSDVKGKWTYKAVRSLAEALNGADFVVLSILPGTFNEMASDVHLPEEYGIYQSVGDTVGPAGLVRALRTIPMYVEIAENIKKYAPKAWVINYTNPMTLCTRTLYEVFPDIKAIGSCHEVFSAQNLLSCMLKDMKGIEGATREDIKVNVLGINHFTWINKASYRNIDLMELYKDFAVKYYETGFIENEEEYNSKNYFRCSNRVKFDLYKRYGLLAASGDRHLSEFLPPWYLKNPETVEKWGFGLTPISYRMEKREDLEEKCKRLVAGEEEFRLHDSGEEAVSEFKAILGLGDFVTNTNIPNRGQIEGLPLGAVVETNALFSRDNVSPVWAGKLPFDVQSIIATHIMNQETILKAALNKDKELAFRAFVNDPLVTIDIDKARELFERMLKNTKAYLPGWNI
jgi:alpha-galactosidase